MPRKYIPLLFLLLASCTVGPDYKRPNTYEDQQIAQTLKLNGKPERIAQNWYTEFADPRLDELVAIGLRHSPSIGIGVQRLRQARSTMRINRTQYLPELNAAAKYDYGKASNNIGAAADTNYFQLGFDATWEIDIWGAGRRLNEQSMAQYQEAAYNLRQMKVVLAAEIASNYFGLKTAQEKLRIAKNNLKLQQDIHQTVKQKFEAGLTSAADYNQAAYVVETTKAAVPGLETQIENYRNALAVLAGILPNELPISVSEQKNNPVNRAYAFKLERLNDLPADIIRSRPDVQAAERALAAQNAAIGQAVAQLYPNVSISALFGYQSSAGSRMFNSGSQAYSYNPSILLPLFNWGRLQENIELQKQIKDEVFENYRQSVLEAVQELANAMTAVRKEYAANQAQKRAVNSMEQVISALRLQYDNGLIEFSDLLQTEQNLLEAQTNLAESNGKIYQNIIAFYKASGGGYNQ